MPQGIKVVSVEQKKDYPIQREKSKPTPNQEISTGLASKLCKQITTHQKEELYPKTPVSKYSRVDGNNPKNCDSSGQVDAITSLIDWSHTKISHKLVYQWELVSWRGEIQSTSLHEQGRFSQSKSYSNPFVNLY